MIFSKQFIGVIDWTKPNPKMAPWLAGVYYDGSRQVMESAERKGFSSPICVYTEMMQW